MTTRRDPERHQAQVSSANRARARAFRRLRELYPEVWRELYADEAAREGVAARQ